MLMHHSVRALFQRTAQDSDYQPLADAPPNEEDGEDATNAAR